VAVTPLVATQQRRPSNILSATQRDTYLKRQRIGTSKTEIESVRSDGVQEARSKVASLTPREYEVFERVAAGQANKVIAIDLGISERTVEIHRGQVMQKSGVRTLADLVRMKVFLDQAEG